MNTHTSRRRFLQTAAVSASAVALARLLPAEALGANDRIRFGVIGCGGMGTGHLTSLVKKSDTENIQVLAVSDVYQRRLTRAKGICKGDGYLDYRKLLDRNDIDAILIATPDHWHSNLENNFIDALRGKGTVHCNAELGAATMVAIKMAVESFRRSKTLLWDASNERVMV